MKPRVAILISGRGTNMRALATAAAASDYPAQIALVLTNNPEAAGLTIAESVGIPTAVIDHRPFRKDRQAHEQAIQARLIQSDIQLVCLAGYMRLLTPFLVDAWRGRMLNIHPSLLPAFPGLHTHARALDAGVRLHGCTVHLVSEDMDAGPILAQAAIPVLPTDTEDTLAARVLRLENALYPAALAAVASGKDVPRPDATDWLANPLPRQGALP